MSLLRLLFTPIQLFLTILVLFSCSNLDANSEIFKIPIAVTMIFRNDAIYLKEWVEYHHLIGVEKFYLYNNLSTDDYLSPLQPYIENGLVELTEWPYESIGYPDWDKIQIAAYQDALKKAKRNNVKWLAIIDSDEFLCPRKEDTLSELLERYDDCGAVNIYWVMFGTSWISKIPDDRLLIETLLLNEGKVHHLFKCIARVDRCHGIKGPHHAKINSGYDTAVIDPEIAQINHYWSRDEYHLYETKIPRHKKLGYTANYCIRSAEEANKDALHYALPIQRFVPLLRKKMGFINE